MLITEAFAQAANQAPPVGGAPPNAMISQLLLFVPLIAIFYFLIIRPQNKRMKEHREMISNVRRGDTVVTGGGIVGKVVKVEDNEVQVEIADGVRIRVVKGTITEVRAKGEPAATTAKAVDDKSAQ